MEDVSLKPILKPEQTYSPDSPHNSIVESPSQIDLSRVETLSPSTHRADDAKDPDEMSIFEKNEAIIKHFKLDKEFRLISSRGTDDDPIYLKVKCPLPKELDFSDDSDVEQPLTEEDLRIYRGASRREYEGQKMRLQQRRERKHIIKRSKILNFLNPAFTKRVSFDTVNKIIDDPDSVDFLEEALRNNLMDDGGMGLRHGAVDPQDYVRGRSAQSPYRDRTTFSPDNDRPTARYHSPHRLSYGDSKIINIDSIFLTRIHRNFEELYDHKSLGPKPVLPGRTILVYISGRRHTWVALDWLFRAFLENGDTIIVVAAVNPIHALFKNSSARKSGGGRNMSRERAKHESSPEHVRAVAAGIMKYCLALADPDLVVRIAVELPIGSTKSILRQMYDLYKPTLIITSAKRKMATFPAVAWRSSKIGDKLVSSYTIPIILVPAPNMDLFEFSLFLQLKLKYKSVDVKDLKARQKFQYLKLNNAAMRDMMMAMKVGTSKTLKALSSYADDEDDKDDTEEDDADNVDDESDVDSIDSEDDVSLNRTVSRTSSILELRKTCQKIEKELEIALQEEDRNSRDYFKNMLVNVTDASREMGIRMAMIEKENGSGASLIRTITGAPSRTKYRSLLDVGESPPITKLKSAVLSTTSLPISNSSSSVPRVLIQDDTSPLRPLKSTLKFDINTPQRELLQRLARKSVSGNDSTTERPDLLPMRSTPQMKGSGNSQANEEKDKMRRNKFSSFFKFGRKK